MLSSKIHCVLSVMVDLHCLCQSLRITAIALSRHVAAFSAVKRQTESLEQLGQQAQNSSSLPGYQDSEVQFLTCRDPCPQDGIWP